MISEAGFAGQIDGKDLDPFVGVERRLDQATDVGRFRGRIWFFGYGLLLQLRCCSRPRVNVLV